MLYRDITKSIAMLSHILRFLLDVLVYKKKMEIGLTLLKRRRTQNENK